jgi:putative redox protein
MTSQILYQGNLRTTCTHLQSKNYIYTDAPTDNFGKGEYFSPTDLIATALGACIITTLGIFGQKENRKWEFKGTKIKCTKVMYNNPRRIGEIHLHIHFSENSWNDKEKMLIERVARTCPVKESLNPNIKVIEIYHYDN